MCDECGNAENPELLLRCAGAVCATTVHVYCSGEEKDEMPIGAWLCGECEKVRQGKITRDGEGRGGAKLKEVVIRGPPKCCQPGCGRRAWYGIKQTVRTPFPEWCGNHKQLGMVKQNGPICEVLGCKVRASYTLEGKKMTTRCATHKERGMVQADHLCEVQGCRTAASYTRSRGRKATRCAAHKQERMVNIHLRCEVEACAARARWGFVGRGKRLRFCTLHKEQGMQYA